jgi:hypothetical protein
VKPVSPSYEPQASIEQEVDSLVSTLLRGVSLGASELDRARTIVRADVAARREVPPSPPAQPWAAWDRGVALMAERDEALAALLHTNAQHATFTENAAAHRRMIENLRREAERQRGGGPLAG